MIRKLAFLLFCIIVCGSGFGVSVVDVEVASAGSIALLGAI